MTTATTIYHNPACGTSRQVLALIRQVGIEPVIIEYLKTPPSRAQLLALVAQAGGGVRTLLRSKEALVTELGLQDPSLPDDALIDAMLRRPVLINRPIVVTSAGTRLCRPAETVLDILPPAQPATQV